MKLKLAVGNFGHTVPIKSGEYPIPNVEWDVVEVEPILDAYRRMVRHTEFDVSALTPTTYLLAREHGAPFTALPIFLSRRFHHGDIHCGAGSGIYEPGQLANRRVGTTSYAYTTAVWVRAILAHEYQVDLDTITWVVDDEEHVAQYHLPKNVTFAPPGWSVADLLEEGKLDALIGGRVRNRRGLCSKQFPNSDLTDQSKKDHGSRNSYVLMPDHELLEASWYKKTGIFPMHSLIVVKDEIVASFPQVVRDIYDAFIAVKDQYVQRIFNEGPIAEMDHRVVDQRAIVGEDPLPYGLEPNRQSLEALVEGSLEQRILTRKTSIEELFVPGVGD